MGYPCLGLEVVCCAHESGGGLVATAIPVVLGDGLEFAEDVVDFGDLPFSEGKGVDFIFLIVGEECG